MATIFELILSGQAEDIPSSAGTAVPDAFDDRLFKARVDLFGEAQPWTSAELAELRQRAQGIAAAILRRADDDNENTQATLEKTLHVRSLTLYDTWVREALSARFDGDNGSLRNVVRLGRHFFAETDDPVLFELGLFLVGFDDGGEDMDILVQAAATARFSYFALTALEAVLDDPTDALLAVARRAKGEPRKSAVFRLADRADESAEARNALLRLLCDRPELPDHVTAYTCATAGRLDVLLLGPETEGWVVDAACRLIRAITAEGWDYLEPDPDFGCLSPSFANLDDLAFAPVLLPRLIEIVTDGPLDVGRLHAVACIVGWANVILTYTDPASDDPEWRALSEIGWTVSALRHLAESGLAAIRTERWKAPVAARPDSAR